MVPEVLRKLHPAVVPTRAEEGRERRRPALVDRNRRVDPLLSLGPPPRTEIRDQPLLGRRLDLLEALLGLRPPLLHGRVASRALLRFLHLLLDPGLFLP